MKIVVLKKKTDDIRMEIDLDRVRHPTVSVFMMSYNHGAYISQALEGILMQNCDFDFVVVVGDDCSQDKTREIILEYASLYPGKFKLLLHERNIGASENQRQVLANCIGKYIALCEGDDYWTDPLKLKKQIDFLESNPDYNFSMGKVKIYNQNTGKFSKMKEHVDPAKQETYVLKDYLKHKFSQTSSFVFRNNITFPDWFSKVHAGDQAMVVIATGEKKIKYHNDYFSVYRVHDGGVTNNVSTDLWYAKSIFFIQKIDEHTKGKYRMLLNLKKRRYKYICWLRSDNIFVRAITRFILLNILDFKTKRL